MVLAAKEKELIKKEQEIKKKASTDAEVFCVFFYCDYKYDLMSEEIKFYFRWDFAFEIPISE